MRERPPNCPWCNGQGFFESAALDIEFGGKVAFSQVHTACPACQATAVIPAIVLADQDRVGAIHSYHAAAPWN